MSKMSYQQQRRSLAEAFTTNASNEKPILVLNVKNNHMLEIN